MATRRRFRVTPRFYALLLVLVLVMLGARLVQGWVAEHRLTRELEVLQEQIEARRAEIQRLEAEVAEMQTEAYVERRAREALGLVLPGEERYQVIPAD
ncbi:FtsB family cell division protein [Limnochorda sp.]|mgnify:FL=1|uniref:FtsB family cell division protein n=1 Tax=Limnochorda sp. TaxID=1940279 RepID=UPI00396FD9AC